MDRFFSKKKHDFGMFVTQNRRRNISDITIVRMN